MTTNLNSNPYYDDFSEDKDFHQVLFRPGYAVQARELTQSQSIIRNQIAKFGGHIFKHGSVVIPGNSYSEMNVCYVKLIDTSYDVTRLEGKTIIAAGCNLKGFVKKAIPKMNGDPATIYVSYSNTGNGGEQVFPDDIALTLPGISTTFRTVISEACGGAAMAFVNKGVYFVNGAFANVAKQSAVISKYSSLPSCHVLLKIVESIVTADDDNSLLDPAQGSYNYAAPGADRLKLSLTLTVLPLTAAISDDFIELMRYEDGALLEHARYPKYNELEKNLARRTYDESGDYIVNGLATTVREHLRVDLNGGRHNAPKGNAGSLVYTVDKGKAYIRGFECEVLTRTEIEAPKARGVEHIATEKFNLNPLYGQCFYVNNLNSLPSFRTRTSVNLADIVNGNIIGTATLLAINYYEPNTTDLNAIYSVYVTDVAMNPGKSVDQVGALMNSGVTIARVLQKLTVVPTNSAEFSIGEEIDSDIRCAEVVKWSRSTGTMFVTTRCVGAPMPIVGDNLLAVSSGAAAKIISRDVISSNSKSNLLFQLPFTSVHRVKNESNASDMAYSIYFETTVNIVNGAGLFTVSGLTIDPKSQSNMLMVTNTGVQPISRASVALDGMSVSFTEITPPNTTMRVFCSATKRGASQGSPKTKTLVLDYSEVGISAVPNKVQLKQADLVRVNKIISSVESEGDVTDRYLVDNGQNDYVYGRGFLTLKGVRPTGTLTVNYDYFNHNNGDYLSIDSYEISGLEDYYNSVLLSYTSKNSGKSFNLRNCLDFRPRVGENGTLTGVGASTSNLIQVDSRLSATVQHYIGRRDLVVMDKGSKVKIVQGVPEDKPKLPKTPEDSILLGTVYIPPYTFRSSDCKVIKNKTRGYTMRDIGTIDARVSKLEDYVTLTQSESAIVDMDIIDAATGLSRFKSGYLVETFGNIDTIADIRNEEFKVSYVSKTIRPLFEVFEAKLQLNSDLTKTTVVQTGGLITLPYTRVPLASQLVSSKITNVNPFTVFDWLGSLSIVPTVDTWTDVENLPAIVNRRTEIRDEWSVVTRPSPPIVIPAPVVNNITNVTNVTIPQNPPAPVWVPTVTAPVVNNIQQNPPVWVPTVTAPAVINTWVPGPVWQAPIWQPPFVDLNPPPIWQPPFVDLNPPPGPAPVQPPFVDLNPAPVQPPFVDPGPPWVPPPIVYPAPITPIWNFGAVEPIVIPAPGVGFPFINSVEPIYNPPANTWGGSSNAGGDGGFDYGPGAVSSWDEPYSSSAE